MTRVRLAPVVLGLFGVLWCAYPLLPAGNARSLYSDAVAVVALGIGLVRATRIPTTARRGWLLVVLGFAGWVLGDLVFTLEEMSALEAYPAPSDLVYLGSYGVIAAGLLRLVRGRKNRSDPTPVLDAAIVAVGFGILVWTFLVAPISSDSTLSLAGRLVASAYPVADVLLLGVLVRLWSSVGARSPAFHWLLTGLTATMVADITWNLVALRDPRAETPAWLDMLWLLGYLATAAAASSPSARHLGGDGPGEVGASARRRLLALGCGLVLPGLALLADGIITRNVPWITVSVGSMLMSVLVLTRMGLLIRTVEVQAVQLAALARSDGLTGAPNRRTWDHELGRAVQQAEETGEPLAVALVDLDHFKRYNDTFGHQAGDLLLREAVAAWTALLQPGELLARYGGEEFGLVLPGTGVAEAAQRLHLMQSLTPRGQRFSGGVAAWLPGTEPADVVALADRALYDAKHAGRGCVRVANAAHDVPSTPPVQIALQPVVDLVAGRAIGHEALSRFADGDPEQVFAQAHRAGNGNALEAAAIRYALERRPTTGYLSVNVSVGALISEHVRAVLPNDLHGLVLEITEQADTEHWDEVAAVVADCRARGAHIAIDDWGRGYSTMERTMRLRPEVVKLDRSLVDDLEDPLRQRAVRTLVDWAHTMGATVCAEGIEHPEQAATLRELGVTLGQGYLFGKPMLEAAATASLTELDTATPV